MQRLQLKDQSYEQQQILVDQQALISQSQDQQQLGSSQAHTQSNADGNLQLSLSNNPAQRIFSLYPYQFPGISNLSIATERSSIPINPYLLQHNLNPSIAPFQLTVEPYEVVPTPRTRSELLLYRLLEQANLLSYFTTFISFGKCFSIEI